MLAMNAAPGIAIRRKGNRGLIAQKQRGRAWSEAALELDQQFHELISRSAGNDRLAEEIGKYRNMVVAVHAMPTGATGSRTRSERWPERR